MSKLRMDIITIFPEYLEPLRHALLGKAIEQGILTVGIHNLRDWATGRHKSVDAPPLGGGPGMVMKPEVWGPALDAVAAGREGFEIDSAAAHRNDKARHDDVARVAPRPYEAQDQDRSLPLLLVPTPAGTPFTQADAQAFSREEHIVIACGRYEGIDQRVFEDARKRYRVREVSIGDYVLIGGEVAALVIAEAVTRLIPGVLGNTESHEEDSFSDGLLEGPAYTKPRQWRGIDAPEVLLSGDHAKVRRWRRDQALLRTQRVRPELLEHAELDAADEFTLHAREVELVIDAEIADAERAVRKALRRSGVEVDSVEVAGARVIVRGRTALSEGNVKKVVDKARRVL
ncbi:tRNA (guanosine(37)-N1)-methyltransferase TrmD [Corynebacterium sanguinis]|uniref:tRNA (guanosine(37)-N1)-methyltransferase TrmD n=1 Tax=Corynebacterium sanguinis TaxID=2594913 RepID=UPI00119E4116|nr:tRNA (guanosine(37)-N1)-methyltransferase TrmD [Corynebacterium sanguinis]